MNIFTGWTRDTRSSWTCWTKAGHRRHRVAGAHPAHGVTQWRLHHHPGTRARPALHQVSRAQRDRTSRTHSHRSVGSHHHHLGGSIGSTRSCHTSVWTHHHRSIWSHHWTPRSHHSRRPHTRGHHTVRSTVKWRSVHISGSHHSLPSIHGVVWWRSGVLVVVFPFLL